MAGSLEEEVTICPYCGTSVTSWWVPQRGCLPSPDYELVADWVFHSACWDEMAHENLA